MPIQKVAIIGMDCWEPSLVFERWIDRLPNIQRLLKTAAWGNLESCMPPITVPAWSCMATSRDPGTLGVYGFRNRKDYSYDGLEIATNLSIRQPRVWDILGGAGHQTIAVGVPQTFPITRPMPGTLVTCFLTPGIESNYTYPPELKTEIARTVGEYMVDVKDFRTENKAWLLQQIYTMTDRRFALCQHLLRTRPWSLFWMVEMGTDRIHHGFWQNHDPQHHRFVPGNEFEHAIRDYYVHVDRKIGELLGCLDLDATAVLVVSDHGAKRMDGGICFNDWLIREGYLRMKTPVAARRRFDFADVDWADTQAWGEGGYYGRLFINQAGRERDGVVAPSRYEALRDELIRKLEAMTDPQGRPLGTKVYKPERIYKQVNGVAPDLIVIFGDLHWRSVGTIGNESLYTFENDTGPDDANHAQQGMYVVSHPSLAPRREDRSIYDVAPTVLKLLGQPVPADMIGRPIA